MKKAMLIFLVALLSLTCLLIGVEQHSMDINIYYNNYKENNIEKVTGRPMKELLDITEGLIKYIKVEAGNEVLRPHYNEKEILHMEDVQLLFKYGFIIKYISIVLALGIVIYFAMNRDTYLLGKYIFKGMFVNWIIIGLLLLMVFFDFNKYFTYFHLIFFSNDLWLLDPNTDLLIQMLPEEFFINIAIKIGVSFFVFVATIQAIGYLVMKKGRKKNEKKGKFFTRK